MITIFINYVPILLSDRMVAKFEKLAVDVVEYDLENPRIAMAMEMYRKGAINSAQVALALNDSSDKTDSGTTIQVLKESIRSTGTITQPIIVNHVGGKYIVIEGNTRLMIYREFLTKNVQGDWSHIPALVHENMTEDEKHSVRLQSHIVGPRAWNPYSKAKYLKKLRDEDLLSTDRIIDLCGGKKQEIMEMIDAYDDMEMYYRSKVDDFDPRQFSAFRELNGAKKRVAALETRGYTKDDFAQWVVDGKIGEATNVRRLAEVLNDDNLHKKFIETDLKTAIQSIHTPVKMGDVDIKTLADSLVEKIGVMPWSELSSMKSGEKADVVDSLSFLQNTLNQFMSELGD